MAGSVDLISDNRSNNSQSFPIVDATDVRIDDNTRLSDLDFTSIYPNLLFSKFELDSNGCICQIIES